MQDEIDAIRFAAEQNDTLAQTYLGTTYFCGAGEGGSRDYAEAAKWFRLAVEQLQVHAPSVPAKQIC